MNEEITKLQKYSLLGILVLLVGGFIYINNYGKGVVPNIDILDEDVILERGDTFDLYTVTFQNKLTWKSSNEEIVSVDENGKITALSSGETSIIAHAENGTQDECKVTVVGNPEEEKIIEVEKIEINKTSVKIKKGEEYQLEAKCVPSNSTNKKLTWTSSNENIVKVTSEGLIYGISKGTANISVKSNNGKKETCKVTVEEVNNEIVINRTSATIEENKTIQLTVKNAKEEIKWTSSDESIAVVSKSGLVKGIKKGKATITGSASNKKVKSEITVKEREIVLELNKSKISIEKGSTYKLKATLDGKEATNITWTSSNPIVAEVSLNGEVKAINSGTTTITVKTNDGKSVTCKVTVTSPFKEQTLKLSKTNETLKVGEKVELSGTIDGKKEKNLTWNSSNSNVASITKSGEVKAIKSGTTTITASKGELYAVCKITVIDNTPEVHEITFKLNKTSETLKVGEKIELTGTADNTIVKDITWKSSDASVASVSTTGQVTALKEGTATITATYSEKKATCTIVVTKVIIDSTSVTLNKTSINITEGGTYQLVATVSPNNATNKNVTWTSDNSEIATVNNNGLVTALKEGNVNINAITENGKKATCVFVVEKAKPKSIKLNKTKVEAYLNSKNEIVLSATISPSNIKDNLEWTSSNENVATVSNGKIVPLSIGETTITVETSNGKTATANVIVKKNIIIEIGASQSTKLKENVTQCESSNYIYNVKNTDENLNKTLVHIAQNGVGMTWQYDSSKGGYKNTYKTLKNYSDKKEYIDFNIYYLLIGNTILKFKCDDIGYDKDTVINVVKGYNDAINTFKNDGYNIKAYVVSMHPVTGSLLVKDNNNNYCNANIRSNWKYNLYNNSVKELILKEYSNNLTYVDTFNQIMDVSVASDVHHEFDFKIEYKTVDNIHFNSATSKKYMSIMLEQSKIGGEFTCN